MVFDLAQSGLKKRIFPKGIRRKLSNYKNRLLNRTSESMLAGLLSRLNIEPGSVICVHSMLSAFGYLTGGPQTVFRAVQRAVPGCTIMMPTFPFSGTAIDYFQSGAIYDPQQTPSQSGLLTDVFWRFPGAKRSLHPTHPCAALGPMADYLIDGSERAVTPFGDDSTYGRFSQLPNAVLLLLNTNGTSIVHRFQEMVSMPNLFMEGHYPVSALGQQRTPATYSVRLHTPNLPLYVVIDKTEIHGYLYAWLPDYALLFPSQRRDLIVKTTRGRVQESVLRRQRELADQGVIRTVCFRQAEIAAIRVGPWQTRVCNDLRESLSKYPEGYSRETLLKAQAEGRLY
jgi:aminoglycoside N3'-acetyltransferase